MPRRRPELLLIAALISLSACAQATQSTPPTGAPQASQPATEPNVPSVPQPAELRPGLQTIQEIVRTDPRMTRAAVLLNSAPEYILSAIGAQRGRPFTLLVPSNEAFDALPDAVARRLAGEGEDPESFVRAVVGMHWAEGVDVHLDELASGTEIQMAKSRVTYTVNDGLGHLDYAIVLDAVAGSNGYVYLIDTVLIPPCEVDVGQDPSPPHAPCEKWLEEPA